MMAWLLPVNFRFEAHGRRQDRKIASLVKMFLQNNAQRRSVHRNARSSGTDRTGFFSAGSEICALTEFQDGAELATRTIVRRELRGDKKKRKNKNLFFPSCDHLNSAPPTRVPKRHTLDG
jgi:hypothetical protein